MQYENNNDDDDILSKYGNNSSYKDIIEYLRNKKDYDDEKIVYEAIRIIRNIFHGIWHLPSEFFEEFVKDVSEENLYKIISHFFEYKEKYKDYEKPINISRKLKFAFEIETAEFPYKKTKVLFDTGLIEIFMKSLNIPKEVYSKIIINSDFRHKNENNKWTFSDEEIDKLEVSTPILTNTKENINQIVAICLLLKAIRAEVNGGTSLQINIGVDYLECNEKALEYLLKIWEECEELFFMIANPEGEVIRNSALAFPIKSNIQDFFEKHLEDDGSISLKSDEEMEKFLLLIQAQNRMENMIESLMFAREFSNHDKEIFKDPNSSLEEKYQVYKKFLEYVNSRPDEDDQTRWTSINFNHMKWNYNDPGRVEVRIFNSSFDPKIIFQDLLLVARVFEVSLGMAKDSNYKKDEFQELLKSDVTEEKKLDNLLDLLFDDEDEKRIFKRRWQSVRGRYEYGKYETGKPTYKREDKNKGRWY